MFENLFSYQQKMMQIKNKMRKFLILLFCLLSPAVHSTEIPMDIAVLRGLDKVTGRMSTFSIPVGEVGQFGKTFVVPEACYTRPPEEFPENSAFLYVFEKSLKGENIEMFKGWMFSSNPALSSMEHPVYDIWIIGCEKDESKILSQNISKNMPQTNQETDNEEAISSDKIIPIQEGSAFIPSTVEMEEL